MLIARNLTARSPFADGSLDRPRPDRPSKGSRSGQPRTPGAAGASKRRRLNKRTRRPGEILSTFTTTEDHEKTGAEDRRLAPEAESGVRVRAMDDVDLDRILELRAVVRWAADPRAFELLRGIRHARWAVAETPGGELAGMVGAVAFGRVGVLCHLAVHDAYRNMGLGMRLSRWAVAYLRSRGAATVRLYATREAEGLYRALGFRALAPRTVYRLEGAPNVTGAGNSCDGYRVEPLLFGDLPELYGADYWSYGADRSALLFAILRLHPGMSLVARDSSQRIKGYLIRSAAKGRATRIGPFAAANPLVAWLLLARSLETATAPVEITVPGPDSGPAHELLGEFGFAGHRDRLLMELGENNGAPGPGLVHYGTTPYLAT
jgi:ribosomal protein S18 acetylase RimI-like enzyme